MELEGQTNFCEMTSTSGISQRPVFFVELEEWLTNVRFPPLLNYEVLLSRTLPNFRNVISPNQSNIVKKLLTSNISSVNLVGGMLRKSWHRQMYLS